MNIGILELGEMGLRRITDEDKLAIFTEWLGGASFRELSEKFDVGLGSISRIIDECRKASPDIDLLRRLNVRLKKGGFTSFDALRACGFLEYLNGYGIGLNELQLYIKMSQKILSDKNLQDNAMTYAVKLMQLEEKCQKPFEKVIEDFEKTVSETATMKAENAQLKLKNRELELEAKNTTKKIEKLNSRRDQILTQFKELLTAHKLLQNVGLKKLLTLAKFNQDFETLDFNIKEIRELSILKQDLINMGIQPDNLKNNIEQVRSLSDQATSLKGEVESLENNKQNLLQKQHALIQADLILQTNMITLTCKSCWKPMYIPLPTKQNYNSAVSIGGLYPFICNHCRQQQNFTPLEIAAGVGWTLLR